MDTRRWLSACVIVALALLAGWSAVSAQQGSSAQTQTKPQTTKPGEKPMAGEQPNEQDQGPGTITSGTVNVRLPVAVTEGKTNRFITDWKEADFEIYEDKTIQKI